MYRARGIRMSPIFPSMKKQGAVFGEVMGYERPSYFREPTEINEEEEPDIPSPVNDTFSLPRWFHNTGREYHACRNTAGLLDYSSFSKFDIQSQDERVVSWLQYLCSNDVDIPVGNIIHTGLQNER